VRHDFARALSYTPCGPASGGPSARRVAPRCHSAVFSVFFMFFMFVVFVVFVVTAF
jgi:hypothetical protein